MSEITNAEEQALRVHADDAWRKWSAENPMPASILPAMKSAIAMIWKSGYFAGLGEGRRATTMPERCADCGHWRDDFSPCQLCLLLAERDRLNEERDAVRADLTRLVWQLANPTKPPAKEATP
jgi:hypothetical protein